MSHCVNKPKSTQKARAAACVQVLPVHRSAIERLASLLAEEAQPGRSLSTEERAALAELIAKAEAYAAAVEGASAALKRA